MNALAGVEGRWGWKDPRNSITMPFWRSLLPDAKVVICVRNPAEVAASLSRRNNLSVAASSRLWLQYYESLLTHVPHERRVITVYENYFEKFDREFRRVCAGLGLVVDNHKMAQARACAKQDLRHNRLSRQELLSGDFAPELIRMYDGLLEEAETGRAVSELTIRQETQRGASFFDEDATNLERSRFHAETAQREEHMRRLVQENALLKEKLATFELTLKDLTEQMNAPKSENLAYVQLLSSIVEKTLGAQSSVASRHRQILAFQHEMEKSLKDTSSNMPDWIRHSKSFNSLHRHLKRVRKTGKLLLLQSALNEAISESLGALTHLTALVARNSAQKESTPPGLEWVGTDKTKVGISELATLIRGRLS
jgi:hypothetical protein